MNLITPRSQRINVRHEHDGKAAGYHLHHWDGRVDAVVHARPARSLVINPDTITPKELEALLGLPSGGAFNAASGMYTTNFMKVFDATQLAMALLADTVKIAMYTNAIATMSYYTDVAQTAAPYNANEVTGTGYTAAGYTLANKTISQSPNGTVMIDNTVDPNWSITGSFATAARGAVVHDTTIAANGLICAINFGGDFNVTNGTFTIQFNSLGIATILFAA